MQYRDTLSAIAEAAIPAGTFMPAAGDATAVKIEQIVDGLPWPVAMGVTGLLRAVEAAAWLRHRRSFRRLSPAARLEVLETFQADVAVDCDVVVVGTGAGGAVVGRELTEAGLAVVFVEEGAYFDRADFSGRAFARQRKMYRNGGATIAIGNAAIPIPLGRTVGGSTTVNAGTCYRTPDRVLARWRDDLGLHDLGPDGMGRYFERVEAVLGVERVRKQLLGGNARVIARDIDLSGFHPLGTARMGRDPSQSVVGPDHQCHDTPGLYIVDGAAVPGALGVNPQVTIMALATRAAEQIAAALA